MFIARVLSKIYKKEDGVILIDYAGQKYICGNPNKEKPIILKFLKKNLDLKLIINPELEFPEAYMRGEIVIENTADFDVELVKVSCTVLNGSGVTVGGDVTDYEDVFITPKSTEKIDLSLGWSYHKDLFEGELDKISVLIEATSFKRDSLYLIIVGSFFDFNDFS